VVGVIEVVVYVIVTSGIVAVEVVRVILEYALLTVLLSSA
jgi:hypothetical protein